jgi:hypothetical protein
LVKATARTYHQVQRTRQPLRIGTYASARRAAHLNDGSWNDGHPDVDDAVEAMLAVAAREVDETWLATWLRDRVTFRT